MQRNFHHRLLVPGVMTMTMVVAGQAPLDTDMNDLAERYVKLVLAMGQLDSNYVDAYYGLKKWRTEAKEQPLTLDRTRTAQNPEELVRLRRQYLRRQLNVLLARVQMLDGQPLPFDDESNVLYDSVAPSHPESYFEDP